MRRHILTILLFIVCASNNLLASNNKNQEKETNIPSDSILIAFMQQEYGIQPTNNNDIHLLKSGEEKFIDLFQEIEKAKHHIHLEYFNFRNDSIANALFDLLALKVKEGVEVRAIFDAFGNSFKAEFNFICNLSREIFTEKLIPGKLGSFFITFVKSVLFKCFFADNKRRYTLYLKAVNYNTV